jgi:FkbM family methyltransferase
MTSQLKITISEILDLLPEIYSSHARDSATYLLFDKIVKNLIRNSSLTSTTGLIDLGCFGEITFPFTEMGAVTSLNLFELDELIIFSFYWKNRSLYRRSADIGANLGLHSILMSRCGWNVDAYEPDPNHIKLLCRNLELNKISNVNIFEAAVSDKKGTAEFVRVLGNTTGSHLAGAKQNPYGELEKFSVTLESINNIFSSVDFIKMDVEGQERKIILATDSEHWKKTDMMLEVGSPENASDIFFHLKKLKVNAFSQKNDWKLVTSLDHIPSSYKEGSLFISARDCMPWD